MKTAERTKPVDWEDHVINKYTTIYEIVFEFSGIILLSVIHLVHIHSLITPTKINIYTFPFEFILYPRIQRYCALLVVLIT